MAIIVKNAGSDTFTPAPEGVHQAVCIDVIDKGVVETEWNGRKREVPKVVIRWALDAEREDGKPFFVDQWYTASLSQKATLRQHLETWRGRAFTADELAGFDLEALIGVNCHLVIIHNYKDERTYANVKGITPLGKNGAKMEIPMNTCGSGTGHRGTADRRAIPDGRGKRKIRTLTCRSDQPKHLRELQTATAAPAKTGGCVKQRLAPEFTQVDLGTPHDPQARPLAEHRARVPCRSRIGRPAAAGRGVSLPPDAPLAVRLRLPGEEGRGGG